MLAHAEMGAGRGVELNEPEPPVSLFGVLRFPLTQLCLHPEVPEALGEDEHRAIQKHLVPVAVDENRAVSIPVVAVPDLAAAVLVAAAVLDSALAVMSVLVVENWSPWPLAQRVSSVHLVAPLDQGRF